MALSRKPSHPVETALSVDDEHFRVCDMDSRSRQPTLKCASEMLKRGWRGMSYLSGRSGRPPHEVLSGDEEVQSVDGRVPTRSRGGVEKRSSRYLLPHSSIARN